jgi:hypothetical protein
MLKHHSAVPGGVGFFSLFDLPPTVFKPEVLQKLGQAMSIALIPGESAIDSGYVYLAQFISHDISKRAPPPAKREFTPAGELEQLRTPQLDLDNVYGDGFYDGCIAVDEKSGKMLLGKVVDSNGQPTGDDDLPRLPTGKARIADDRDDENLLVAQLHLQFLKLHNFIVDHLPATQPPRTPEQTFNEARRVLVSIYQDVVLHDFLPTILDPRVCDAVIGKGESHLWATVPAEMARMPVEFAMAAFRFAHAMVRLRYALNRRTSLSLAELFGMTGAGDFNRQFALPETHVVDWKFFFSGLCPQGKPPCRVNKALRIDPSVVVPTPLGSLAELDLRTGNRSLLASGQDIVEHIQDAHSSLELVALTQSQLNPVVRNSASTPVPLLSLLAADSGSIDPYGFSVKSPLWYYLLCEALATHDGDHLGPLGSQIVAETLRTLVFLDSDSATHQDPSTLDVGIEPKGEFHGRRHFLMTDLLRAVGPRGREAEASRDSPPRDSNAANDRTLEFSHVA